MFRSRKHIVCIVILQIRQLDKKINFKDFLIKIAKSNINDYN